MRQKLIALQGKTEESTASLEKSALLFAEVPRSSRQKISRDVIELNSTINQLDAMTSVEQSVQQEQKHIL